MGIYRPDGGRFLTFTEIGQLRNQERQSADREQQRADQERQRADRLAERLREMGVNPNEV